MINQKVQQYNAAVYLRLSKEDMDSAQKAESNSIVNQKQLILGFLQDKPDIKVVSIRIDDGYTGTNFDRPQFQLMMDDIKAGLINCVVVKDLSRFGREYINAGKYIDRLFLYNGIRLIAINDGIDTITRTQSDELNITLKNLINDSYCRDMSIKVRSHLQVKRKNGEYIGAFTPFGYRKAENDHNQLEIDDYAASVVEDIFRWKLEGMSQDGIAKRLTADGILSPMEYKKSQGERFKTGFETGKQTQWTSVAVPRILTNPVYIGTLIQGIRTKPNYKINTVIVNDEDKWVKVENAHKPIVSERIFNLVQRLLLLDTRTSPKERVVHPLAGLVICGDCKGPMVKTSTSSGGKKYCYYICDTNKKHKGCTNSHRISESDLEQTVLLLLREHIRMVCELDSCLEVIRKVPFQKIKLKKVQERQLKIEEELERYRRLKLSLYEDMKDGLISKEDYMDIKAQYDERIASQKQAYDQAQKEIDMYLDDNSKPHQWIQDFMEHRNITELTRMVAVECIDEIAIYEDRKIEVSFTHWQDYSALSEQVREYYQENHKEVV